MKTKNEETDEAAADKAAKEESKKKPKKPEAPDAVEKAMGKAKKGHPGGIQHFRDKIMQAGKDAVKKHDEKLANEDRSPEFQKDIDDRRKRGDEESAKRLEAGEKKSDDAVAAARKAAVDKKRAEIHKRSGGKPPRMGGLTASTEYKRMGLYLAEAMGYRIDELLPAVAAMAGRAVVGKVAGKIVGKGLGLKSDKDKKKEELAAQDKSAEVQEEGKAAVIKKALTKVAKNPKVRAAVLRAGSQAATSMADKEEKKTQTDDDLKEDSRRGGRYGSSPHGGRPVGGLQDPVGKIPNKLRKERLKREKAEAAAEAAAAEAPKPKPPAQTEGKIMNKYVKALMEKAGRDLSPVQKRYEGIPASKVAAAKTGRGGVDASVQADVGAEAARTQAKVPGSDPDAAHLLAQKKARDAKAKAKGEKPTGDQRGHGTPNPIQPSRT